VLGLLSPTILSSGISGLAILRLAAVKIAGFAYLELPDITRLVQSR
jgi:hypothetical protein